MTDRENSDIRLIPILPQEIIEANEKEKLAVFIGAGVSRFLDCTSWKDLSNNLIKRCKKEGLIDFLEQEMLSREQDVKKTITICNHILGNDERFMEEMKKSLNDKTVQNYIDRKFDRNENKLQYEKNLEIYRDLFKLDGIFITTNADRHIDQIYTKENIVYKNFNYEKIDNHHLYKIHGSIVDQKSLVFTVDRYIETYIDRNFSNFLNTIFAEYTVLFVGYSMGEFELLDYMFKSTQNNNKKHFFLKNYFSHQKIICNFDQIYFDKLGIKLIPYNIDKNGFNQLKEIIKNWVTEIKYKTNTIQNNFDDIDASLQNPTKKNIDKTIQAINNNEEYKIYFFQQSTNYLELNLWLEPLLEKELIDTKTRRCLDFLEIVSIQNKEQKDNKITQALLQIADNAIRTDERDSIVDWHLVKIIFNLPKENITLKHIDFIATSIKNSGTHSILKGEIETIVLPVLLENSMKKHILVLLDTIFGYITTDENNRTRKPILDEHWLDRLLKKHSHHIIKVLQADGLDIVLKKLREIHKKDKNSFSTWTTTIEDGTQNSFSQSYDNQLIFFIRDSLTDLKSKRIETYIENFLTGEIVILRRVAFYVINQKYDDLKSIFWKWFNKDISSLNLGNKHEFYELIKNRCSKFTDEEFKKLIDWIENLDYSRYRENDSTIKQQKYQAYKRKEWLLYLKRYSPKAKELYDKYHSINPIEVKHPGYDIHSTGFHFIEEQNPIADIDKFCNQSIDNIVKEITTFNPDKIKKKDFIDNSDLVEKLASNLITCIQRHPNKVSKEIDKFSHLEYIYKYNLIYGFTKAWKEKLKFDWGKVFDFILNMLNDDFFASKDQYAIWLRGGIADLIQEGTQQDSNAFEKKYLGKAKNILFKLLENMENDDNNDNIDLVTDTLNSTNGKILHALMNYSLRYARLNSSKTIKWEKETKAFFTKELEEKSDYSRTVFTILGDYLPQLIFLDKGWVETNLNKIFSSKDDLLWEIAIEGYFRYSSKVYIDIYQLLKANNHIEKALEHTFKSEEIKENIIRHICVMFFAEKDNNTIYDIIKSKNQKNLVSLIYFIWGDTEFHNKKASKKIFELWNEIYEIFKDETPKNSSLVFSALSRWFVFLTKIEDTIMPALELTTKYTNKDNNLFFITEEFARLADSNPKCIGKLYLEMLENHIYPTYEKSDILSIIESLYRQNENKNALKICNKYKMENIYILNEICKKHKGLTK